MRRTYAAAILVSVLLHLGLFALLLFSWQKATPLGDSSVSVTLVASARPAPEPAPVPQQETAPPQPPEPQPQPAPQPAPSPPPKPVAKAITPPKPVKPQPGLDLNQLAQSLSKSHPSSKAPPGPLKHQAGGSPHGAPGPVQLTQGDFAGLVEKVREHWQVNCDLPGSKNVEVQIRTSYDMGGNLVGEPKLLKLIGGHAFADAGSTAIAAVKAVQPVSATDVSLRARNQTFILDMKACTDG